MRRAPLYKMGEEIAKEWIVDYFLYQAWVDFKQTEGVSYKNQNFARGLIEWMRPVAQNSAIDLKLNLIWLLVLLEDGRDCEENERYNDQPITPLERTIPLINSVVHHFRLDPSHFCNLITSIKLQAVLVCCRNGKFDLAQSVYSRLWEKSQDQVVDLSSVIKSSKVNHQVVIQNSYSNFLQEALKGIEIFHINLPKPVLLKASGASAKYQMSVSDACMSAIGQSEEIKLGQKNLKAISTALGETDWKASATTEQLLQGKLPLIRQKMQMKCADFAVDSINPEMEADEAPPPQVNGRGERTKEAVEASRLVFESREIRHKVDSNRMPAQNLHHYRRNWNRPNRHAPSVSDSSSSSLDSASDEISFRSTARRRLLNYRDSSPAFSYQSNRRGKGPWSDHEVANLKKGVRKYGVGKWALILKKMSFPGRTNVNLKDKWRNLVDSGKVEPDHH